MARTLDVYLHRDLVGHLIQNDDGQMIFCYAESWLSNPVAMPLSHSLPLRTERFTRKECSGFFGGILPEQSQREIVAKNLGISAKNDFAMLEQIGGECAGAVTFMRAGESLPERNDRYRDLSNRELVDILKELPRRPLLAGDEDVRLSLAGAQDKVAVKVSGEKISIPLSGALSTHILKPANQHFEGLTFNEALCLKLARASGLSAAKAETRCIEGIDYLLVERYDRKLLEKPSGEPDYERLHQEDFCQALGFVADQKYQSEGGPSLKQCFDLLREVSTAPVIDIQRMLDAVIFNYLIGNNDAHAKNFSLLYPTAGEAKFAPLYDLVCTVYYPNLSKNIAMKIGGEYRPDLILPLNFEKLADEAGLAKPLIKQRVPELALSVKEGLKTIEMNHSVEIEVTKIVLQKINETISRFTT